MLHVTPGQDEGSTRPTPDENTAATHAPHLIRSLLQRCGGLMRSYEVQRAFCHYLYYHPLFTVVSPQPCIHDVRRNMAKRHRDLDAPRVGPTASTSSKLLAVFIAAFCRGAQARLIGPFASCARNLGSITEIFSPDRQAHEVPVCHHHKAGPHCRGTSAACWRIVAV